MEYQYVLSGGEIAALIFAAVAIVILIIIIKGIKIVPQTQAYVVERLGKYYKTWGTGVHFLVPFIDKIATDPSAPIVPGKLDTPRVIGKVNLKEQVIELIQLFIIKSLMQNHMYMVLQDQLEHLIT